MPKLLLIFLLIAVACTTKETVTPGIPLELAEQRRNSIQDVVYDLSLDIPASRKDNIQGIIDITFTWKSNPADLQIDFMPEKSSLKSIAVNGTPEKIRYANEHILVAGGLLTEKTNTIRIEFIAGNAALNRNDDFLYSLFVPARASTCFPVFDQPDIKAIYRLSLRIPRQWEAISNGRMVSTDSVSSSEKLIRFSETRPTSSYQFAFTAGRFFRATDPESGMSMLYRETDTAKVKRNLGSIFGLHKESLAWLKQYTGIDYPYEKFDFALMPAFQFGGMEHPGSIFYRESSLFLEPTASVNEELRRAGLIAHETAHMWFGNLVTMQWFNDVWLKEVFANFMAAKMVSPSFPTINHDLRFLMGHYPSAYDIDRSAGAHPIQQPLDNLRNAGSVYGAIIYQKAPIMMRHLEEWMGPENFQQGLKDYLNTYSYKNATWDDLVAILQKYSKQDLAVWNKAWIKTAGRPEIFIEADPDGKSFLKIVNDSTGIVWPQTLTYFVKAKDREGTQPVTFRQSSRALLSKWVEPGMKFIPNYKGRGYGYFDGSSDDLFEEVSRQADAEVRAGIWMNVWEIFLLGRIKPELFIDKLIHGVSSEKDPLLLEYLTDKLGAVYWQFLDPAQRSLLAKSIDDALFERMSLETDNSIKRTLFNTYRFVANSPDGVANLKKLWSGDITLGLELSERDKIQLAYALAVRQAEGYEQVLQKQYSKITNPDRREEVQFVLPALSSDPVVRDKFFERLSDKANRVREPWVLEALRYLHHPLRSSESVRYLPKSLDMLEELQRTGDIFFPKGWLDATLGEYQTKAAADAVRDYLEQNKGLRQDLKNKLLQSSDMLFRAESIVESNQGKKSD